MLERGWSYLFSVVLVVAIFYPLQTQPLRDSFPLSTYPMFTTKRPAYADIDHVVGVAGDDRSEVIRPGLVASSEVLQTKMVITEALRQGRRGAKQLCEQVSRRVADDADLGWVQHIEVRSDRYMVLGYFGSARKPVRSNLRARCEVDR